MKLLLDEMYWPALAEPLVARGHDVISAKADASLTGLSDEDLFAAAQVAERAHHDDTPPGPRQEASITPMPSDAERVVSLVIFAALGAAGFRLLPITEPVALGEVLIRVLLVVVAVAVARLIAALGFGYLHRRQRHPLATRARPPRATRIKQAAVFAAWTIGTVLPLLLFVDAGTVRSVLVAGTPIIGLAISGYLVRS